MTSVLIVEDHPIVRNGLGELLSSTSDLEVVGTAGNGETAITLAAQLQPDVVLMDIELPVVDGIAATSAIVTDRPETVVVILSTYDDAGSMERAIAAGAGGYLHKNVSPQALLTGIRTATQAWVSFLPGVELPLSNHKQPLLAAGLELAATRRRVARRDV
jgi:DNA-binding NarL/FixJ family response regulator